MLTLLECMKNNLPSNDSSKFKTTESHMDWEKVAFKDFSGDMCKLKWVEISNEVTDTPPHHRFPDNICVNPCLNLPGGGEETEVYKQEGKRPGEVLMWSPLCIWEVARLTALA